jgi:hypothetical protein
MTSIIKNNIRKQLVNVLEGIYKNPSILENKEINKEINIKLNESCNKDGQGSGNKATPHEINFAQELEKENFQFLHKKFLHKKNINQCVDGFYYVYQINGTQKAPDFSILDIKNSSIISRLDFDLKHSNTSGIVLNDGWFCNDTVYIISYQSEKKYNILVGLGQDIPKEEEHNTMMEIRKIKEELNKKYKSKENNLRVVFRFANHYKCNFSEEEKDTFFTKLKQSLECDNVLNNTVLNNILENNILEHNVVKNI